MNYLDQLANYFGVTQEEILKSNKDNLYESHLTIQEQDVIKNYRLLSDKKKNIISELLEAFASS